MAKAFSYARFSTPEQKRGDSLDRQVRQTEAYCAKHGLQLDTELTFRDLGVSAFHGQNANGGALGAFLKAVEEGVVQPGDCLVVEHIDRLSRQTPRKALRTLESIVESGVDVITLNDEKRYDLKAIDDPMGLMWVVMIATKANQESADKAKRLRQSWLARRKQAEQKPIGGRVPGWLRLKDGKFEVITERVKVVKRIYREFAKGKSVKRITEDLNGDGVPCFGGGRHWHRFLVTRMLDSTAPIGIWQLHTITPKANGTKTRVLEKEIPEYFPRVVPEEVYERVQAMRRVKVPAHRGNGLRSLLAGMARCSACGGSMTRTAKGPPSSGRGNQPLLVCMAAKVGAGCSYKSVRQEDVERAIIRELPITPKFRADAQNAIDAVASRLSEVETTIANLVKQAGMAPSKALSDQLYAEEDEERQLNSELEDLVFQASPLVQKRTVKRMEELVEVTSQEPLDVARANALMRQLFKLVVIDPTERHIQLHWQSVPDFEWLSF
jgi:DNA invertase Pin-like site-specific DNA recombinase